MHDPSRYRARFKVMLNLDLSPNARILYFLIDDKAGESGEMWWHWRKLALALGVGRAGIYALMRELMDAKLLFHRHENRRIIYRLEKSRNLDSKIQKSGLSRAVSISEPSHEPKPPLPPASGGIRCETCLDSPRRIPVSRDGRAAVKMWCPACGGRRRSA